MKNTKRVVLTFAGYRLETPALHASNDPERLYARLAYLLGPLAIDVTLEEYDDKAKRWRLNES